MSPIEVFVYGTLMRGGSNHGYLAGQKFVAEAATRPSYRLYELDGYPGMVEAEEGGRSIPGEIWAVGSGCLARLDELEGVAEGLYRRAEAALLPPHDRAGIMTYLYLKPTATRRELSRYSPGIS